MKVEDKQDKKRRKRKPNKKRNAIQAYEVEILFPLISC